MLLVSPATTGTAHLLAIVSVHAHGDFIAHTATSSSTTTSPLPPQVLKIMAEWEGVYKELETLYFSVKDDAERKTEALTRARRDLDFANASVRHLVPSFAHESGECGRSCLLTRARVLTHPHHDGEVGKMTQADCASTWWPDGGAAQQHAQFPADEGASRPYACPAAHALPPLSISL